MKKRIINAFALAFGFSVFGWIMFLLGHFHGKSMVLEEENTQLKRSREYDYRTQSW